MIGRERLVPGDRLIWLGTPARTGCVIFEADAYCQIVCRTWQPKLITIDKVTTPVLFNDPDLNSFPADIHQKWLIMVDAAMRLPRPRSWAPRGNYPEDEWALIAADPPSPEFWLPQLKARRRHGSRRGPGTSRR